MRHPVHCPGAAAAYIYVVGRRRNRDAQRRVGRRGRRSAGPSEAAASPGVLQTMGDLGLSSAADKSVETPPQATEASNDNDVRGSPSDLFTGGEAGDSAVGRVVLLIRPPFLKQIARWSSHPACERPTRCVSHRRPMPPKRAPSSASTSATSCLSLTPFAAGTATATKRTSPRRTYHDEFYLFHKRLQDTLLALVKAYAPTRADGLRRSCQLAQAGRAHVQGDARPHCRRWRCFVLGVVPGRLRRRTADVQSWLPSPVAARRPPPPPWARPRGGRPAWCTRATRRSPTTRCTSPWRSTRRARLRHRGGDDDGSPAPLHCHCQPTTTSAAALPRHARQPAGKAHPPEGRVGRPDADVRRWWATRATTAATDSPVRQEDGRQVRQRPSGVRKGLTAHPEARRWHATCN